MKRFFGILLGVAAAHQFNHVGEVFAFGYRADTAFQRVGAVLAGVVILAVLMALIRRFFYFGAPAK